MMEIGRVCVKIAGRDAALKCVIVDQVDENHVMIDGETRRRKCNLIHLEPMDKKLDIEKGASHSDVVVAFKKLDIEIKEKKPKKAAERPRKQRKKKVKEEAKPVKEKKKVEKKKAKEDTKKKAVETPKTEIKKEEKK